MYDPGFSNGVIFFDADRSVYYSGQVVTGSVRFNLDYLISFSAITIECYGVAHVEWTETQTEKYNGVKREKGVKYKGHEEYFRFTQCLAGGNGTHEISSGFHTIPFKFQIPQEAPSSFKGDRGYVKYHIDAYMAVLGQARLKEKLEREFTVVAPFDLNLGNSQVRESVEMVFDEIYGCECFWSRSPVNIHVSVPVSGFCPGQVIPISVDVNNDTPVEIRKIIFQLLVKECYRSSSPPAEYVPPARELAVRRTGPVLRRQELTLKYDLTVPDIIVPNLENCRIIDVGYFLKTTIKFTGCQRKLQDETEICLGLVPLHGFTVGAYVHPMAHSLPNISLSDLKKTDISIPTNSGFILPTTTPNNTSYPVKSEQMRTAPYPTNVVPNQNPPYPTQNIVDVAKSAESKPPPFCDYEIGFKMSDSLPSAVPVNPPYPSSNLIPQSRNGSDLRIYLPPLPMTTAPSAPPPSS